MEAILVRLDEMLERIARVEESLANLSDAKAVKEWYGTAEVAKLLGKAEFTVREWCRLGRVHASKRACGRGPSQEWMIAHEELQRLGNEGLLPNPVRYRHPR